MARNYVKPAATLRQDWLRGMPDGLDERFFQDVEYLWRRIDELELALKPFAIVGQRAITTNDQKDVLLTNRTDCVNAYDVMNPDNSYEKKKETWFPA